MKIRELQAIASKHGFASSGKAAETVTFGRTNAAGDRENLVITAIRRTEVTLLAARFSMTYPSILRVESEWFAESGSQDVEHATLPLWIVDPRIPRLGIEVPRNPDLSSEAFRQLDDSLGSAVEGFLKNSPSLAALVDHFQKIRSVQPWQPVGRHYPAALIACGMTDAAFDWARKVTDEPERHAGNALIYHADEVQKHWARSLLARAGKLH